jgi:hypothetical protein
VSKHPSTVVFALVILLLTPIHRPDAAPARPTLVQSVDIQVPFPPMPVTIAGQRHLAYELHVTNFRPVDVELLRVDVIEGGTGNRLASLRDSQLLEQLSRIGAHVEGTERRRLPAGGRAILYLWLPMESGIAIPRTLQHSIELDLLRPSGRERTVVTDRGHAVRKDAPVTLGAPLHGGPWVALYNPTMVGGHRTSIYTLDGRARIPARFAIDWVRLETDATHARGDDTTVANWHGYGADVLAVADGIIVDAVDDMREGATISAATGPIALENASGNHVTLDLGQARYAFYEHLQHGSIAVKPGERVKRGQVIASLGNSGSSSSGPHLHFHVADAANELAGEGIPYVFQSFEVVGAYDGIDTFRTGERWQPFPAAPAKRNLELPAANTVIVFPPKPALNQPQ